MKRVLVALEVVVDDDVDVASLIEDVCNESQAFEEVEVVDQQELE